MVLTCAAAVCRRDGSVSALEEVAIPPRWVGDTSADTLATAILDELSTTLQRSLPDWVRLVAAEKEWVLLLVRADRAAPNLLVFKVLAEASLSSAAGAHGNVVVHWVPCSSHALHNVVTNVLRRQPSGSNWAVKSALFSASKLCRQARFAAALSAGVGCAAVRRVRRAACDVPPPLSAARRGLLALFTQQSLGLATQGDAPVLKARIEALMRFFNGPSLLPQGDGTVLHFCNCCDSDAAAQAHAAALVRALLVDAGNREFSAHRWHKVVLPLQVWACLLVSGGLVADAIATAAGTAVTWLPSVSEEAAAQAADGLSTEDRTIVRVRQKRLAEFVASEGTPFQVMLKLWVLGCISPLGTTALLALEPEPADSPRSTRQHPVQRLRQTYVDVDMVLSHVVTRHECWQTEALDAVRALAPGSGADTAALAHGLDATTKNESIARTGKYSLNLLLYFVNHSGDG
jgi:hypothetical protein